MLAGMVEISRIAKENGSISILIINKFTDNVFTLYLGSGNILGVKLFYSHSQNVRDKL